MSEGGPSNLRLRFETVGSITAIVVGVIALLVSWDQARVMRQDVAASVWPALQIDGFADTSQGDLALGLRITNAGVGPALIERISIYQRSELVTDLDEIQSRVGGDADMSYQTATGRILAAGAVLEPFVFRFAPGATPGALADDIDSRIASGALTDSWEVEVCYCSSLGQCWTADTDPGAPVETPRCDARPASDL